MKTNNLIQFGHWLDWRPNRLRIEEYPRIQVEHVLDELGLSKNDYQIKGHEIRFATASNLAFLKLNLSKHA